MPLLVQPQDLQPGMRLGEAFTFRGRVMLPGGKVLGETDVDVLRRKFPQVTLRVVDPLLDTLVEFEDDGRDRETAATVRQKIAACMTEVQERYAAHTSLTGVDFGAVRSAAEEVMRYVQDNPPSAALLDLSTDTGNPLAEHTGTVFYLTVVLGTAVRDYVAKERQRQTSASNLSADVANNLLPLGLGAMFMDVGMYPLQRVFAPGYVLTDEDREAVRRHPLDGADLLPDNLPTGVKMVVRTHHENYDGTGYPKRQPGPQLHVFTRIARICDAFGAATSQRAYRGAKSPARAVWEMSVGHAKRCYDPSLMKVFASLIQPFPIGAKLTLADGRQAVVVRYNRKDPLRPTGIVAYDVDGSRLPNLQLLGPVTLGPETGTRIASFAGEDLSYLYDAAPPEPASPPAEPRRFATLLEAGYP